MRNTRGRRVAACLRRRARLSSLHMRGQRAMAAMVVAALACLPRIAHAQTGKPTLFLVGDSTVNVGTTGQVGWGERLADYFDPAKIAVVNAARGGRSSRTFQTEGLWSRV